VPKVIVNTQNYSNMEERHFVFCEKKHHCNCHTFH